MQFSAGHRVVLVRPVFLSEDPNGRRTAPRIRFHDLRHTTIIFQYRVNKDKGPAFLEA